MELLAAALIVLGLLAVVARFLVPRGSSTIRLPPIVDESIGMWLLRRLTGRLDPERVDRPGEGRRRGTLDPAVAARLTAAAAPRPWPPLHDVPPSRTPLRDLRRRDLERQLASRRRARRLAARPWRWSRVVAAGVAAIVVVAGVAVGSSALREHGSGSDASRSPSGSGGPTAVLDSGGPSPSVAPLDAKPPVAAITTIRSTPLAGRAGLEVTVTWTIVEVDSGVASVELERQTDGGAWSAVELSSAAARSVTLPLSRGHTYAFRVRATDRAGNVGPFAERGIRL